MRGWVESLRVDEAARGHSVKVVPIYFARQRIHLYMRFGGPRPITGGFRHNYTNAHKVTPMR